MKNKRTLWMLMAVGCLALPATAQEKETDYRPEVHGTIRAKYENQFEEGNGRFEVRNARISLSGKVTPLMQYKAEIDLSDEGNIKMLDAYTRFAPLKDFQFTIGQMRVPFTIDAHRSPHQQYFANRSFIAKQAGNVRDVGATLGYRFNVGFPIQLEGGLFNGSGLTNQKDFWGKQLNYSAKAQLFLPEGFNLTLSVQKIRPEATSVYLYDVGAYYHSYHWHVEAEYLRKRYENDAFQAVNVFDGFINYDHYLRKGLFRKLSFLARYDFMGDHSDGTSGEDGRLKLSDSKRHRLTGGVTLSLAKPFVSDIRINYENYFYRKDAPVKVSEHDKIVVEFMVRF